MQEDNSDGKVLLTCIINREQPDQRSVSIDLFNGLPETIHIFDSPRMPYFIYQDDESLLILFGVNPPDPEIDYGMIDIPMTRPLPPGQSTKWQIDLSTLYLKDHYESDRAPADLHGAIRVVVQIGWGATAIEATDRFQININALLAWQNLVECVAGEVVFP